MATNFVAKLPTSLALIALAFRNGMGQRRLYAWLNSANNAAILCKVLVKINRAVSEENSLIHDVDGNCAATRLQFDVHSSATTRPIFVSLSAYVVT